MDSSKCYISGKPYEANTPEFWEAVGKRNWREQNTRDRPFEFRAIADRIADDRPVLEIGCAYGYLSDHLPEGVEYIGVDVSPYMVEIARGLWPGRTFLAADIWELAPSLENAVGTVVAQQWVEHYASPQAALELCLRLAQHCLIVNVPKEEPEGQNPAHLWTDITEEEFLEVLEGVSPPDGEVE